MGASEDFAEGWSAAPEEQLGAFIDMERVDLLSRGAGKSSPAGQDILMYRYILEMSDEEIAGLLNIKPGSVRMCLSRARKKCLCGAGGGGDADMNYEYPLNRNRLRIEQEELLLKLALSTTWSGKMTACGPGCRNSRTRRRTGKARSTPWTVPCGGSAGRSSGKKAWQVSGRVVTRVAVVFLTFFICLSTAFCGIPVG